MKPSVALDLYRQEIRYIVEHHHATNARVFGSVLHGNDQEGSDLDLLVEPTNKTTLMDLGAMRSELHNLLKIQVDVLTPKALPENFRNIILAEAISV